MLKVGNNIKMEQFGGAIMYIKGIVKKDRKTKRLVKRLEFGEIALIDHKDLDEVGAISLVEKGFNV